VRDPNAAVIGMASLELDERGAYNTILDLIYAHDRAINDVDRLFRAILRVALPERGDV
jgi:hypothetical protein